MGFLYWNGESQKFNRLDLCISAGLERLIIQCRGQTVPSTKYLHGWYTVLGSHAAATWEGSRSSAFYFEFLFQMYPFNSPLPQPSVVCSPSTAFLFSISLVVHSPCTSSTLLNSRVFQHSFLFHFEISYILLVISSYALSWEESSFA